MKVSKLTLLGLTVSLAMMLSFVETQIPPLMPTIPGMKMGLANIAIVFALYRFGGKEALCISLVRLFLAGLLFNPSTIPYSLAGAVLSFMGMVLLKRIPTFSSVAVSVVGGVLHNVGQIAVAILIMETVQISYWLPFLLLSGTISGVAIGVAAGVLVRRIGLK